MKEGIDPKLKARWNRKLREAGLQAKLKPMGTSVEEILSAADTEASLKKFANLPDEIQDNILADIKKQSTEGISLRGQTNISTSF